LQKTRRVMIIAVLIISIVSAIACSRNAYTSEVNPTATSSEENTTITETSLSIETIMPTETTEPVRAEYPKDLLEWAYTQASDEQKRQLDVIKNDKSMLLPPGQWTKRILVVMNELSADTPMLTMDQIKAIFLKENIKSLYGIDSKKFQHLILGEFNQIAGAPDYEGGSGVYGYTYFLNAERTEVVSFMEGECILLYTSTDPKGNRTTINLSEAVYSNS
jgi:hypothetical protein